jgi:hypothetical protein
MLFEQVFFNHYSGTEGNISEKGRLDINRLEKKIEE